MSHSTTATSTYVLGKYSKSYPTQKAGLSVNPGNNTSEWQHFTNPTIRLILDIKQAGTELESVRLRIIWSMESGDTASNLNQSEVVFEDIDLLSFSSLPYRQLQKNQVQGLPLKAVYRDTVVGIRYLHLRDTLTEPVYRRFQVTFLSPSSVLEFIEAIRTVCPCKANPIAAPGRGVIKNPISNLNPSTVIRTHTANTLNLNLSQAQNHQASLAHAPQTVPSSSLPIVQTLTPDSQAPSPSKNLMPSSYAQSRVSKYTSSPLNIETSDLPSSLPSHNLHTYSPQLEKPEGQVEKDQRLVTQCASQIAQDLQKQTSLPSSSPIPSADNNATPPDLNSEAIISSLRDTTALYDLPRATLEQLIGNIVREDGFVKLLENIASIWKVKSLVGI